MNEGGTTHSARKLVALFAGSVPERELRPIWENARAGNVRDAATDLMAVLARERVAITPDERRSAVELLHRLGVSTREIDLLPEISSEVRMDIRAFARLAHSVVARLAPKVETIRAESIARAEAAGSWRYAITELVALLTDGRIPVTEVDREELRRLMLDLGESTEDVDRLSIQR